MLKPTPSYYFIPTVICIIEVNLKISFTFDLNIFTGG